MKLFRIKITLMFLLLTYFCQAQSIDLSINVDSLKFKIGEQVEAKLELNAPVDSVIEWPLISDTIGGIEVVERSLIDTFKNGDYIKLIQKLKLTQFDTGNFVLSPIRFKVGDQIKYTKPIMFEVLGVEIDTSKQNIYDIKKNIAVPYTFFDILPYLFAVLVFLAMAYYLYKYFNRKKIIDTPKIVISPFEFAMNSLLNLDNEKHLENGNIKDYYDSLSDILRRFLEDEHGLPAMESTSDEILSLISKSDFSNEIQLQIKELLVECDFVKFAKYLPDDNKHHYYRVMTEDLIKSTRIQISNTEEDDQ